MLQSMGLQRAGHNLMTEQTKVHSGGAVVKTLSANVRDMGLIPGLGRSPGEGTSYPLQNSGLENSRDCTLHGAAKSQTRLSNFHFHFSLLHRTPISVLLSLSGSSQETGLWSDNLKSLLNLAQRRQVSLMREG